MESLTNLFGTQIVRWNSHGKGLFTVSSAYKDLNQMGSPLSFLSWKLQKVKIPYKWLFLRELVLTHDKLRRREIHIYAIYVDKVVGQLTICSYIEK